MLKRISKAVLGSTSYRVYLILTLIAIAGAYLRFARLGGPSFWVDEMNHVAAAQSIMDGKGPVFLSDLPYTRSIIFTRLVSYSFALFGVDEFAARFPSAIFGTLTIGLMFFVGWRMFGRSLHGLAAALLYAFNPFMIGWARECRMYSMFQFLFILGTFALYEGFEGTRRKHTQNAISNSRLQRLIVGWNLDWLWIAISVVALILATSLQILSGVLFPSLVVYAILMVIGVGFQQGLVKALNAKYVYFLMLAFAAVIAGKLFLPEFFTEIGNALAFSPNWSQNAYLQNRFYYLWFIASAFYFTVAAFFLFGTGVALAHLRRSGIYVLLNFVVPLLALSIFFALRVERYIYHLYPLLLLVAAFGVVEFGVLLRRVLNHQLKAKFPDTMLAKFSVAQMLVVIFLLTVLGASDWFRFSRKIPAIAYGTNGAVDHLEWREAVDFLKKEILEGEPVISTLPLTVHFYLGRAEYFLASQANPRPEEVYSTTEGLRDYYSNSLVIDTLQDLEKAMALNPRGWIVVDGFRLDQARYVRPEVAELIRQRLTRVFVTPGGTVEVYAWQ